MPYFAVYAPDYTDEGAIERRFKVREAHLANAIKEPRMKVGGAMLSPNEALDTQPNPPEKKMIGSLMIFEADSYAEVKELIENDVYWTGDVWDKEKTEIRPWVSPRSLQ